MTEHRVGTADEHRKAREELLAREKELTRLNDDLAARRRELPWVRVSEEYRFQTDDGTRTLAELFDGRSQLVVYHFMFGPEYDAGCPVCSAGADTFNGAVAHMNARDVSFTCVSRAPLDRLQAYKRRMGWSFPWASSFGSEFNVDFGVAHTEEQLQSGVVEYNFRPAKWPSRPVGEIAAGVGTDWATYTRERPGMSAFAVEDGVVYHTYSSYSRGLDGLWGMYQWLDRAPRGRNETGIWWHRHDEYEG